MARVNNRAIWPLLLCYLVVNSLNQTAFQPLNTISHSLKLRFYQHVASLSERSNPTSTLPGNAVVMWTGVTRPFMDGCGHDFYGHHACAFRLKKKPTIDLFCTFTSKPKHWARGLDYEGTEDLMMRETACSDWRWIKGIYIILSSSFFLFSSSSYETAPFVLVKVESRVDIVICEIFLSIPLGFNLTFWKFWI